MRDEHGKKLDVVPTQSRSRKRSTIMAGLSPSNARSSGKKGWPRKQSQIVSLFKIEHQRTLPEPSSAVALRDTICAEGSPFSGLASFPLTVLLKNI
jgi:hypothetical protein